MNRPWGGAVHGAAGALGAVAASAVLAVCLLAPAASAAYAQQPDGGGSSADTEVKDPSKVELPHVDKQIGEVDAQGKVTWQKAADASVDVDVPYRATGTLPSDWDKYRAYTYNFVDTLDPALIPDTSSVKVEWISKSGKALGDITPAATVSFSSPDHVLKVAFADLKQTIPDSKATDRLRLTYTCRLDASKATAGTADPNDNYIKIQYTQWHDGTGPLGESPEDYARALTWRIDLLKVDTDKKTLAGAAFRVRDAHGRYVKADGTTTDDPDAAEVVTGKDGIAGVSGVDAGTYTVEEVSAPKGYGKLSGTFSVTIDHNLKDPQNVEMSAAVAGNAAASLVRTDSQGGVAEVAVVNESTKTPFGTMPQTCDMIGWIPYALGSLGAAAVAVAVVMLRRRPRG